MRVQVVYAIAGSVKTAVHEHPFISVTEGAHRRTIVVECYDARGGQLLCDHRYTDAYTHDRIVSP